VGNECSRRFEEVSRSFGVVRVGLGYGCTDFSRCSVVCLSLQQSLLHHYERASEVIGYVDPARAVAVAVRGLELVRGTRLDEFITIIILITLIIMNNLMIIIMIFIIITVIIMGAGARVPVGAQGGGERRGHSDAGGSLP
jgi:hypothetical protein